MIEREPLTNKEVRRALRDTEYYIQSQLWIKTKEERLTLLHLNPPQNKVLQILHALWDSGSPIRVVCLKARQMGLSTLFGALLFNRTATRKFVSSMVAAHKDEPSSVLFEMYTRYYDYLADELKPMTKYSTKKELIFANPDKKAKDRGLQSRLSVHTAGSVDFSRSKTVQNIHWSEVAFSKNADELHGALLSSVPKPPLPSMVFYESTANGPSGLFHDLFWEAFRGENDWTAIFLPWYQLPSYRMSPPPNFALEADELVLKDKFDLDDGQIAWRRWTILNDFRGSVEKFKQEYPSTPEEAFIKSTSTVFDSEALDEMEAAIKPPITRAMASPEGLVSRPDGPVYVWEWPIGGTRYVMGIDAAGGGAEGDNLVCNIFRAIPTGKTVKLEQVVRYTQKIHPSQFAVNCIRLGRFYNYAFAIPERNYHGVAVISMFMDRGYYNMLLDDDGEYGVHMGEVNKYIIVDKLAQYIWRRDLIIHDAVTFTALKAYQEKNNRFFGPNDDFVDATRMATYGVMKRLHSFAPRGGQIKEDPHRTDLTMDEWDRYTKRVLGGY